MKDLLLMPAIQVDQLNVTLSGLLELLPSEIFSLIQNKYAPNFHGSGASHCSLNIIRLDQVHPYISGNKWFKLKYNVVNAMCLEADAVLSFGGAWSNHLHALAAAGQQFGVKTIGMVRGEVGPVLTPTLQDCLNWGMTLVPMRRLDYRNKHLPDVLDAVRVQIQNKKGVDYKGDNIYIVPEGGSNRLGMMGVADLINHVILPRDNIDIICSPVGSGGTLAGVVKGVGDVPVLGFSALKNACDLEDRVNTLLSPNERRPFNICHDFHFGGFGKTPDPLKRFILRFEKKFGIALDPIYTAKMMVGIICKLLLGEISSDCRISVLHTGGLQGSRSLLGDK